LKNNDRVITVNKSRGSFPFVATHSISGCVTFYLSLEFSAIGARFTYISGGRNIRKGTTWTTWLTESIRVTGT